jgi:hypothetical protein
MGALFRPIGTVDKITALLKYRYLFRNMRDVEM